MPGAPVAVSSPQGRFAGVVRRRAGTATGHRVGKHLFHHYDGGATVHVHLGLYGKFTEWTRSDDHPLPDPVGAGADADGRR